MESRIPPYGNLSDGWWRIKPPGCSFSKADVQYRWAARLPSVVDEGAHPKSLEPG